MIFWLIFVGVFCLYALGYTAISLLIRNPGVEPVEKRWGNLGPQHNEGDPK